MNDDTSAPVNSLVDKDIAASICQFNFLPIRYMHPTWFGALPDGSLLERLRHCQRAEPRLSRYLLAHFDLAGHYWFEFAAPIHRIALLPSVSLIKLLFYAGLTLNAESIRRTLLRSDVIALKQRLGEKPYLFALKRAPFLCSPQTSPANLPRDETLRAHLVRAGMRCLSSVFYDHHRALTQRLLWKLPRSWSTVYSPNPVERDTQEALTWLLIKLVSELELS